MSQNFLLKTINYLLLFSLLSISNILANDYQKIINHVQNTPYNITNSTVKLSNYLTKPYHTEEDKFAAIYYWIATNISYNQVMAEKPLYYENVDEIVEQVMRRKNGVCQHYAELFSRLSKHAGLVAFVVNGYTRSKDKVDDLSHAWNIIKVDGKWFFVDATWAGSATKTISKNLFPKQFFMVSPRENIKSKMPFDPVWQALSNPIRYNEFDKGAVYEIKKGRYNYNDSIETYINLSQIEQHKAIVRRIKSNGTFNKLVNREYSIMKENYNMLLYNKDVVKYNKGSNHYNKGMQFYNQYARTKNNKVLYSKTSKKQLILMIDSVSVNLKKAQQFFNMIETDNKEMRDFITKNRETIKKIAELMNKERKHVSEEY